MTCPWNKLIYNKKNTKTVEIWLQIKVELKFILLVIKARLKSRTIYKANNVIKWPIAFDFQLSFEHNFLDSQVLLGFGQQNLIYCLSERQVEKKMFLFRFIFKWSVHYYKLWGQGYAWSGYAWPGLTVTVLFTKFLDSEQNKWLNSNPNSANLFGH